MSLKILAAQALKEYYEELFWLRASAVDLAQTLVSAQWGKTAHITGSIFMETDEQHVRAIYLTSRYGKFRLGPKFATFEVRPYVEFLTQLTVALEILELNHQNVKHYQERLAYYGQSTERIVKLGKEVAEQLMKPGHEAAHPLHCYIHQSEPGILFFTVGLRGACINSEYMLRLNGKDATGDYRYYLEFLQLFLVS